MIHCRQLRLEYLPGKPILADVSLELKAGSFQFLCGASGAGKTSLLSLLALNLRPSRGKIFIFGQDVTALPREALPVYRRRIGLVTQEFNLLDHLTVEENVGLPLKVMGQEADEIEAKVSQLLMWIGLSHCSDAYPSTLSGGEKQRVAIARAVITKPDLLLADEPTGNLDAELSMRLMYLFEALNDTGTTVLFATHDEQLIQHFPHPVFRLKEGKMV